MIDDIKNFLDQHVPKKLMTVIKAVLRVFAHNFYQKAIAVFTAFVLWFFVMEAQDPTIEGSYEVSVMTSNAPYEFIVTCDEKTVKIKTLAPRSYFVKYNANAFRAYANLEGLSEGKYDLTPQIVMPQGFELVKIDPETVRVTVDSFAERQIPFELITKGSISAETAIKNINKSMELVTVMGPKTFVDQVTKVFGILTFSNNTESFEAQIPMKAMDANNNQIIGVRVVPSVVTVSVDLESGIAKKIVPVVAELNVADGWEVKNVTVDPAQIEIMGAESFVNSIVTIKTDPITIQTGQPSFKGRIRLDIPDGLTVKDEFVNISAEIVRKTIVREPATTTDTTTTDDTSDSGDTN